MIRSATRFGFASLILLAAAPASATQRIVPDDYTTIQAACDAAAPGDSVLVRDGTYAESITLSGKQMTLYSVEGAVLTPSSGRIVDVDASSDITLFGLTFRDGYAELGGAMRVTNSHVRADGCTFVRNTANGPNSASGGAVHVAGSGSRLDLMDCGFEANRAGTSGFNGGPGAGGAVSGEAGTLIEVRRSSFSRNVAAASPEGGPSPAICTNGTLVCDTTVFTSNSGGDAAVFARRATLRGCAFRGNGSAYGPAAVHTWGHGSPDTLWIERCTFTDNFSIAEGLIMAEGPFAIVENTIVYNYCVGSAAINATGARYPPYVIERNVIAYTDGAGVQANALFACNDAWQNSAGNFSVSDPTGTNGNISADPGFCSTVMLDLHLRDTSPCASTNNACGALIGAFDVGCQTAGIAPSVSTDVRLLPVAPNPGTPPLRFAFTLPVATRARLDVRDVAGRIVARVFDGAFEAGSHEARWDGATLSGGRARPGVYFGALTTGGRTTSRAFTLVE